MLVDNLNTRVKQRLLDGHLEIRRSKQDSYPNSQTFALSSDEEDKKKEVRLFIRREQLKQSSQPQLKYFLKSNPALRGIVLQQYNKDLMLDLVYNA